MKNKYLETGFRDLATTQPYNLKTIRRIQINAESQKGSQKNKYMFGHFRYCKSLVFPRAEAELTKRGLSYLQDTQFEDAINRLYSDRHR